MNVTEIDEKNILVIPVYVHCVWCVILVVFAFLLTTGIT